MKRLLLVLGLLSVISLYCSANGINGYYVCGSSSADLIAEGDRGYTEIGVKSGNMLELRITKPSSPNCTWELIDDTNTGSHAFTGGSDYIYIQVPRTTEYGKYFTVNIRSGENFLSVRVYLLP